TLSFSSCSLFLASTLAFFSDSFLAFSSSLNLFIRGSRLYAVSVHTHTHTHTTNTHTHTHTHTHTSNTHTHALTHTHTHTPNTHTQTHIVRCLLKAHCVGLYHF